jgi:hypothetical protein
VTTQYFHVAVSDIETRWRPLSAEETTVATVLLADADRNLFFARPTLATAIALDTDDPKYIDPETAKVPVVDQVWRVLINPDSFRTTNVGADGSIGAGYFSTEVLRPRVALAPGDLDTIDRALRVTKQGNSPVVSRRMRNVDYGIPSVDMNALPTP